MSICHNIKYYGPLIKTNFDHSYSICPSDLFFYSSLLFIVYCIKKSDKTSIWNIHCLTIAIAYLFLKVIFKCKEHNTESQMLKCLEQNIKDKINIHLNNILIYIINLVSIKKRVKGTGCIFEIKRIIRAKRSYYTVIRLRSKIKNSSQIEALICFQMAQKKCITSHRTSRCSAFRDDRSKTRLQISFVITNIQKLYFKILGLFVISLRLRRCGTHKGLVKLAGNIFFSPVFSLIPINQPSSCMYSPEFLDRHKVQR
ncbi:hypothetical protein AGLY_011315 [Aphis glycines]|uniref:Uncharacterized protein n=1 Tax=Aphis glycines TaxID=307491 RepID=A0A6G0TD32_APHGL|nr:hypothetical protein AGLY_011315 [Aphis glycines]